jgi:hypothetical protein
MATHLDEARVYDILDAIYRHTCFGDVCGEDDFSRIPGWCLEYERLLFWG